MTDTYLQRGGAIWTTRLGLLWGAQDACQSGRCSPSIPRSERSFIGTSRVSATFLSSRPMRVGERFSLSCWPKNKLSSCHFFSPIPRSHDPRILVSVARHRLQPCRDRALAAERGLGPDGIQSTYDGPTGALKTSPRNSGDFCSKRIDSVQI